MSDLPVERLLSQPAFTFVGLDVFGPWTVVARRTRGGLAHSKRWAILFTCMGTRSVHIEVIEEMTASATINAIRRFLSIRGPVKKFISDNGSNFVGASSELSKLMPNNDMDQVKQFVIGEGCVWEFNPPHSSHMGGVWERMIGVARRILDSMFKDLEPFQLTHDMLITLMAEVSAIINARPLVPVSSDPESPEILSPSMLLTQKTCVPTELPPGTFSKRDMLTSHWRGVQHLADKFWSKWRVEYLPLLQTRPKWSKHRDNLCVGDIVLVRDSSVHRNQWPIGLIKTVLPSDDSRIRKVEVDIVRKGVRKTFQRPISEIVLLFRDL